jgi:spoIIIJ-associated protein
MRSVEVEGGSIDEAIERALHVLGAPRDQVEIDILENATRGLLGIGRRRARVRATMRAPLVVTVESDDTVEPDARKPEATPRPPQLASAPGAEESAVATDRTDRSWPEATASGADRFDGAALLTEILRRIGLAVPVRCTDVADGRRLEIESTDPDVIAVCRDELLSALELLVNRVAERHAKEKTRFTVGIVGRRPPGDLHALARRLAERARARGTAVTVNALDEDERRIVAEALRGERGVKVRTTGGGAQRKLIIIPRERRRSGGTTDH